MSTSSKVGSTAQMRGIAFTIFALLGLVVNAALTVMFGWTFLGGWFGALLMFLFFDGAAVSWYVARLQTGLSGAQRATAKMMSVVTILASTLVSVIQVLLTTNLVDLSPWHTTIGVAGLILITFTTAANFLALFYFQFTSIRERKTELHEELEAQRQDEFDAMMRDAHERSMNKAHASLISKTDAIAQRLANEAERQYLDAMGCLDMHEPPTPYTSAHPADQATSSFEFDLGASAGAKDTPKEPAEEEELLEPEPLNLRVWNKREQENINEGRNAWEDNPSPSGN
jgi:hypothetical protein